MFTLRLVVLFIHVTAVIVALGGSLFKHVRAHADIGRGTRVINIVRIINICGWKNVCSPSHKPIRRTSRVSDSNSIALLERTSLTVYEADIFNCSRPRGSGIIPRGLRPILLTPGVWQVAVPPGKGFNTRSKPRS